ncbi:MAG: N-formylglutamate amidohydrolase [SAR324 cluster bacterium]|nr:N-formylglutamate amidohydrolase [SAR324 cluster bacterium]
MDQELQAELDQIMDHATDLIFQQAFPEAPAVVFPVSRLVVDPERFCDDLEEPMNRVGMGVLYTQGTLRQLIREKPSPTVRQQLLNQYYHPHHKKLTETVDRVMEEQNRCLIIDEHSFPSKALPYKMNPKATRPNFCLGTDDFHTSPELLEAVEAELQRLGYSTARNEPFSGTIVPLKHYRKDQRVQSLMIEINRKLYLNEDYSVDPVGLRKVVTALASVRANLAKKEFFAC